MHHFSIQRTTDKKLVAKDNTKGNKNKTFFPLGVSRMHTKEACFYAASAQNILPMKNMESEEFIISFQIFNFKDLSIISSRYTHSYIYIYIYIYLLFSIF